MSIAERLNRPNNSETSFSDMSQLKSRYDYPNGMNMHPDSADHKALLAELLKDIKVASDNVKLRFNVWKEIDQKLNVYIDLDQSEEEIQSKDERKPVSIVVPLSYATRETLLTYWTAAFMKSPLFQYVASRDPNDTIGTLLLQNIIENHSVRGRMGLALHTAWSDSFTYGFGVASSSWGRQMGYRTDKETGVREAYTMFEGNELIPLDPYNCLPDPNMAITDIQGMSFFGFVQRMGFSSLMLEERDSDEDMFNVLYLKGLSSKTSTYYQSNESNTGRYDKQGISHMMPQVSKDIVDVIHIYKWIVPSDYGLGDGEYPEIWKFAIAADRVIIEASELGLDHNSIPVASLAPDSDGHTTLPVSILEREYPLQHAIDWLWQSHVANVRKTINNMLVVDPSLINMNDLVDTKYGMVARLRAAAWGRGVKDAVEQLRVDDVTAGHIRDIGFLMNIDNLVFTSTQAKGALEQRGERVSAQEARDTRMSFLSKMEKGAKIGAMQFHYPLAQQMAFNTIQLLEDDQYIKLTGNYADVLAREYQVQGDFVKFNPSALQVGFDVVPQDGTIPGGEYADVWERLMNNAAAHKEVYESLDFVRVWKHVARLLGAKNADDFMKRPPQSRVENPETIQKGVDRGSLVTPEDYANATGQL